MNEIMGAQKEDIDHCLLLDVVPQPLFLSNCDGLVIYTNAASRKLGIAAGRTIWEQPFLGLSDYNSADAFNIQIKNAGSISIAAQPYIYDIQLSRYEQQGNDHYLYSLAVHNYDFQYTPEPADSDSTFRNLRVDEIEDYAILMLDREGKIIDGNKGLQNVKGYEIDEIIGKHFDTFYPEEDRMEGTPQKMLSEATSKGKAVNEGWRMRKDGSLFWANVVITAVHDTGGAMVGFTKVTRDFTEKKLADEKREQQARSIEAKNRQLEEFAYITSHDLQEPLRKIGIFTHFIEKNLDNREQVENYLHKISTSATRMSSLINDILEYARVLEKPEEHQIIDLRSIVDGILDDFELLISEKKVAVTVMDALPVLSAIPVQMRQLFTNLINNAIKFSQNNPAVTISANRVTIHAGHARIIPGEYYQVSIADNGIGFEQKYADEIFKPFKRLNSEVKGTGVGLAVCQKIVENHGGAIEVLSVPGKGTNFKVLLPAPIL